MGKPSTLALTFREPWGRLFIFFLVFSCYTNTLSVLFKCLCFNGPLYCYFYFIFYILVLNLSRSPHNYVSMCFIGKVLYKKRLDLFWFWSRLSLSSSDSVGVFTLCCKRMLLIAHSSAMTEWHDGIVLWWCIGNHNRNFARGLESSWLVLRVWVCWGRDMTWRLPYVCVYIHIHSTSTHRTLYKHKCRNI